MKVSYFAFMAAAMWACCGCSSEKSGDKPVADAKIGIRTSILDRSEMRTPSLDSNGSGSFADGDHFSLLVSDGADGLLDFDYETGVTQLYWKDVTFASSPEKVATRSGTSPEHNSPSTWRRRPTRTCCWPARPTCLQERPLRSI